MATGTMTISVPTYAMLQQVAQRVLCWAGGVGGADTRRVAISTQGPVASIVIPEDIMAAHGALALKRGGSDILAGFVTGSQASFAAGNGAAVSQAPNTCPASTNQPTINSVTTSVGGNPLVITLDYANAVGNGTVNINWGDGVTTAGAAESGTPNHTYPFRGIFTITVTDASDATQSGSTTVQLPQP